MIAHRVEDLTPVPTHALLLGQGPKGTACSAVDFKWFGVRVAANLKLGISEALKVLAVGPRCGNPSPGSCRCEMVRLRSVVGK